MHVPGPRSRFLLGVALLLGFAAPAAAEPEPEAKSAQPARASSVIELPYVVGPEVYQVYTDARLYRTRVSINGHEAPLSNDGGNGAWRDDEIGADIEGPIGYPNKLSINGLLVPGKNDIVVEFTPNPELGKYQESPKVLGKIAATMYTRVLLVRGKLKDSFGGIKEQDLAAVLAQNAKSKRSKLLQQKKGVVRNPRDALSPVRYELSLQLGRADKVERVKIEECELAVGSAPSTLTAKAYFNSMLLASMEKDYSSKKKNYQKELREGANALSLEVEAAEGPAVVSYSFDCDLHEAMVRSGLYAKHGSEDIGTRLTHFMIPVAQVNVVGPGSYASTLEISK